MTTEHYFAISDQELDYLCDCNLGTEINNPFYDSAIAGKEQVISDSDEIILDNVD